MKEKNGEVLSIIRDHFRSLHCVVPDKMRATIENSCRIINDILESETERLKELDAVCRFLVAIEKSDDHVASECAYMARGILEGFFRDEYSLSREEE